MSNHNRAVTALIQDWLLLIETLLEWEAYLCSPRMERKDLHRLRKKHQVLMYLIKIKETW